MGFTIDGSSQIESQYPLGTTAASRPEGDLESFRKNYCPGITESSMNDMIRNGRSLIQEMKEAAVGSPEHIYKWKEFLGKNSERLTPQAAINVLWALTAEAASFDSLYTSGAMRIGAGEPLSAARLEEFFLACGGAQFLGNRETKRLEPSGGDAYQRISTHMKESLEKGGPQWGLNLRTDNGENGLPANKGAILFARLDDGTFFIKMENHAVPPFWAKGFRSLKNFSEFAGHAIDFLKTRPLIAFIRKKIAGKSTSGILADRKDGVTKSLKNVFTKFIKEKNIALKKDEIKEAKKLGISKMLSLVGDLKARKELEKRFESERGKTPEGYEGQIKSREVVLPNPSQWKKLDDMSDNISDTP